MLQALAPVRVALLGAGGINFGTKEGPWNHSGRLQTLSDVVFTGVVDPNLKLAQGQVLAMSQGKHGDKWCNTKVFPDYRSMLNDAEAMPDAAIVGVPPKQHGSLYDPKATLEVGQRAYIALSGSKEFKRPSQSTTEYPIFARVS